MSKSFISLSIFGSAFIASLIGAFVLGASFNQTPTHSQLVMASNEVRYAPAPQVQLDDSQNPQGAPGLFVYQGVLNDTSGNPVASPVQLRFLLLSNIPGPMTHSELVTTVTPDAFGRFQVDVPLGDAVVMSEFADLVLRIIDTATNLTISAVEVQPTPRAWSSEYAKTSGSATTAGFADEAFNALFADEASIADQANQAFFADQAAYADEAGMLSDDLSIVLALNEPNLTAYGNGYDDPKAARVGNVVHLSGLVRVLGTESDLFTLPIGMRPAGRIILNVETAQSLSSGSARPLRIDVLSDGSVITPFQTTSQDQWFSLNGCSFIVD